MYTPAKSEMPKPSLSHNDSVTLKFYKLAKMQLVLKARRLWGNASSNLIELDICTLRQYSASNPLADNGLMLCRPALQC
jgi:hypothetical protein